MEKGKRPISNSWKRPVVVAINFMIRVPSKRTFSLNFLRQFFFAVSTVSIAPWVSHQSFHSIKRKAEHQEHLQVTRNRALRGNMASLAKLSKA